MKALDECVMIEDDVLSEDLAAGLLDEYVDSDAWLGSPAERGGGLGGEYPAKVVLVTEPQIMDKSPIRHHFSGQLHVPSCR